MENIISYAFIAIALILVVISVVLGLENMIKIVLGNYILGTISLALMQNIDLLIGFLSANPDVMFVWIWYTSLAWFLAAAKATIVLIIYFVLLFVLYKQSQITVRMPSEDSLQRALYILLVPLAASSMLLTLWIVLTGLGLSQDVILWLVGQWANVDLVARIVSMLPVWILLHGLCTILITSELRMTIKTDMDEAAILWDDDIA
jgi:hypothetical protein